MAEVKVKARYARIAPRKLRLVADLVRGNMVGDAINTLKFTNKRGAKVIYKAIKIGRASCRERV